MSRLTRWVGLALMVHLGGGGAGAAAQTQALDVLDFYVGTLVPLSENDGMPDSRIEMRWTVGGQALAFAGSWNQPGQPGTFVEGLMAWDPIEEQVRISGAFYHGAYFDGVVRILDADARVIRREWTGHYPDGRTVPYRETMTPLSDDTFEWNIEYRQDGEWKSDRRPGADGPAVHRVLRGDSIEFASRVASLPFDPPNPHPFLLRLGALEGALSSCSIRYDEDGVQQEARRFEVLVRRRVYDQVVTLDFARSDEEVRWSAQSSFLMFDQHLDRFEDRTVSAFGTVERWSETTPWEGEDLAFRLDRKAGFALDDAPENPVDFRKAFRDLGPDGYVLVYSISDDEGTTWRTLFRETARRDVGEVSCDAS